MVALRPTLLRRNEPIATDVTNAIDVDSTRETRDHRQTCLCRSTRARRRVLRRRGSRRDMPAPATSRSTGPPRHRGRPSLDPHVSSFPNETASTTRMGSRRRATRQGQRHGSERASKTAGRAGKGVASARLMSPLSRGASAQWVGAAPSGYSCRRPYAPTARRINLSHADLRPSAFQQRQAT